MGGSVSVTIILSRCRRDSGLFLKGKRPALYRLIRYRGQEGTGIEIGVRVGHSHVRISDSSAAADEPLRSRIDPVSSEPDIGARACGGCAHADAAVSGAGRGYVVVADVHAVRKISGPGGFGFFLEADNIRIGGEFLNGVVGYDDVFSAVEPDSIIVVAGVVDGVSDDGNVVWRTIGGRDAVPYNNVVYQIVYEIVPGHVDLAGNQAVSSERVVSSYQHGRIAGTVNGVVTDDRSALAN